MNIDKSKRTALVTGGNMGIGLAVTKGLIQRGFFVYVVARSSGKIAEVDGASIELVEFDLTQIDLIEGLVARIGGVDVLVNNAGCMVGKGIQEYSNEEKRYTLQLNLEAPIELIRCMAPKMVERGGGRIVNNASIAGEIGHPDIWYGVSKAGIINITKSFARSLGGDGIIVNCVAAGPTETNLLQKIPKPRQEAIMASVIAKRFARADEVADVMCWLATECPGYVNGVCIDVNNGAFMR